MTPGQVCSAFAKHDAEGHAEAVVPAAIEIGNVSDGIARSAEGGGPSLATGHESHRTSGEKADVLTPDRRPQETGLVNDQDVHFGEERLELRRRVMSVLRIVRVQPVEEPVARNADYEAPLGSKDSLHLRGRSIGPIDVLKDVHEIHQGERPLGEWQVVRRAQPERRPGLARKCTPRVLSGPAEVLAIDVHADNSGGTPCEIEIGPLPVGTAYVEGNISRLRCCDLLRNPVATGHFIEIGILDEPMEVHRAIVAGATRRIGGSRWVVRMRFGLAHQAQDCVTLGTTSGMVGRKEYRWLHAESRVDEASRTPGGQSHAA